MEKEYKMSQARKDELEQELNYLKTTRSDEVAEQIKIARGFGDLSENSEYDEAKNEQGKLYSRIAELEVILQHVVIVDETAAVRRDHHRLHRHRPGLPTARKPATRLWALRSPTPCTASSPRSPPSARRSWAPKEGQDVVVEAPSGNIHYTVVEDRALRRRIMAEQKNPQAQPELSLSEQTRIRREKLATLQAEGQNPFAHHPL